MKSEVSLHRRATAALGSDARPVLNSFVSALENLSLYYHEHYLIDNDPVIMRHLEDAMFRLRVVVEEMTA